MNGARLSGICALLLGAAIFVYLGSVFVIHTPALAGDFRASYYSARCFIHTGCDPYSEADVFRMNRVQEQLSLPADDLTHYVVTRYVYLPTAFVFTVPFALFPVGTAHVLWMAATAAAMIVAALLMWSFGQNHAPLASGILLAYFLANSGMTLAIGNPAGVTVAFCAIAVWCFVNGRFIWAGVVCLAIGLALKPHDAGFVWLYLVLVGGALRKNALRALAIYGAFALPTLLWTLHIAPHWLPELKSNLLWFSQRGGINDPGPASFTGHGVIRAIDLQAVISVFKDDPHFYNPVSFVLCGLFFLAWAVAILRSRHHIAGLWFVFAGIATLSMLPSYHRPYDAKLLLLTIPAFALLWAERGPIRWAALLLSGAAISATGDFPLALLALFARRMPTSETYIGRLSTILLWNPTPLILLAASVFFLWAFVRQNARPAALSSFTNSPHTSTRGVTA